MFKKLFYSNKGFSLIELVVVIAIIGLLVMSASPRFLKFTKNANMAAMQTDTKILSDASMLYRLDFKDWPIDKSSKVETNIISLKDDEIYKFKENSINPYIKSLKGIVSDYALITTGEHSGFAIHIAGVADKEGVLWSSNVIKREIEDNKKKKNGENQTLKNEENNQDSQLTSGINNTKDDELMISNETIEGNGEYKTMNNSSHPSSNYTIKVNDAQSSFIPTNQQDISIKNKTQLVVNMNNSPSMFKNLLTTNHSNYINTDMKTTLLINESIKNYKKNKSDGLVVVKTPNSKYKSIVCIGDETYFYTFPTFKTVVQ